jgi:hypothetical protein
VPAAHERIAARPADRALRRRAQLRARRPVQRLARAQRARCATPPC